MTLLDAAWFFVIYSFLGWCAEVVFAAITLHQFVNRGFLNGPVCPIYGFGLVAVDLLLSPLRGHVLPLFVASIAVATLIELITGMVLEKLFHEKWWDYSNYRFNFKGYICPQFSLLWGLACMVVIKWIQPAISRLIRLIPSPESVIFVTILLVVFAVDFLLTVRSVLKLRVRMEELHRIENALHTVSDTIGEGLFDGVYKAREKLTSDKAEQLRRRIVTRANESYAELEQRYHEILSHISPMNTRIIKAFPNIQRGRYRETVRSIRSAYDQRRQAFRERKQAKKQTKD